jgi:glycerol-3-phosphate acyltransferase PlsX
MHLFQYGIMASLYLKYTLRSDIKDPRIGLLNIGEEETKGNELLKETYDMFKRSSLNFIGNIEPHDIFQGICDVIVCDGFLGNIILKMGEGLSTFVYEEISKKFKEQGKVMTNIKETLNRMDYSEYGGVPLLGINGIVVKCHGRSRAKAITNAISAAQNFASLRINELIVEEIKRHSEIRS